MRKPKTRTPENIFCYLVDLPQKKALWQTPFPKSTPASFAAETHTTPESLPVNLALEFIPKPRRSPPGPVELTHHPLLSLHGEVEDVPLEVKGHQRRGTDWRDK